GQVPVEVPLAGQDRTGVPTAHGDDRVGVANDLVRERLGELLGDVDPDLGHRLQDGRVDLVGWRAARRANVDTTLRIVVEQSSRHLAATRVVDADEKDLRPVLHDLPSGNQHQLSSRTSARPAARAPVERLAYRSWARPSSP